ncbi:helicase C-terminal domain-containing protein [Acidithiobacillus albertensis]|uniref:helicase C-terminal domain-containing protein n=1 Tax=Acidithiobacillus albertensis TaxID=119978 RepID=UPI001C06960B|nr:helicase C-terminal domain-containing protein [Acidithiobacillus albertensis]MBU2741257.1 hypothetical protein [Acidithiobacillus albertensis]
MTMIEDYFNQGGRLNQVRPKGYAIRREQVAMAEQIHACMEKADALRGERCAILPIQGDTGIGKTLAALVPMLHKVALHRKAGEMARCGYATFTTQLRRQVAERDLPLALEVVAKETGVRLTAAEYWGSGQYLSINALEAAGKELSTDAPTMDRIQAVLDWLRKAGADSGLMVDAKAALGIPEHEPLVPRYHDSAWACTWREARTLSAYQAMRGRVQNADILLLSHAAALVNAHHWFSLLNGGKPKEESDSDDPEDGVRYMVFDEAHRLPDAAASLTDRTVSLRRLARVLEVAHEQNVGTVDEDLVNQAQAFRDIIQKAGGDGPDDQQNDEVVLASQPVPHGDGATAREVLRKAGVRALYLNILKSVKGVRVKSLSESARDALMDVHDICDMLDDYLSVLDVKDGGKGNPYQLVTGLSWSPVQRYPSLNMSSVSPGRMVARYWRHYPGSVVPHEAKPSALWGAVILSATLPDLPEIGIFDPVEEEKIKWAWQKSPYLMIPNIRSYLRFEPERAFGTMDFVLSAATAPATMSDTQQASGSWNNPEWEQNHLLPMIDAMMEAADENDGVAPRHGDAPRHGVLILVPSSIDVDMIVAYGATRPWGERIIAQRKGDSLAAKAAHFRQSSGAVLVSAGGWEGLNLPGQIRHLMIARLPKSPVNMVWKEILREKYDEEKVQKIMRLRNRHHFLAKLKQGIGRGIRSTDDRVTVWVADSRFGIPKAVRMLRDPRVGGSDEETVFEVIPARFRPALNQARIFSAGDGVFAPKAPADLGKPKSLGDGMLKFLKDLPTAAQAGRHSENRLSV